MNGTLGQGSYQSGRTTGLMLKALGDAILAGPSGKVVFLDHIKDGGFMHDDYLVHKLRDMAGRLDIDVLIARECGNVVIRSTFAGGKGIR